MCFALPMKVISFVDATAKMNDGRFVQTGLVGKVKKGDWLLVKSNLAVNKLTSKEAIQLGKAIQEVSHELSERN